MNLIRGHASNGVFTAEHTATEKLKIDDGDVTLGFRAEDAEVTSSKGDITAPIYSIELLGDATMITVRIGEADREKQINLIAQKLATRFISMCSSIIVTRLMQ